MVGQQHPGKTFGPASGYSRSMITHTSNQPVRREFSNAGQGVLRLEDRFLVERQEDGSWAPVAPQDRFVPNEELGSKFGLWKDEQVTTGMLWWKEVVRPLDGKVDSEEVVPMGQVLKQQHDSFAGYPWPNHTFRNYDRLQPEKTELQLGVDGGTLKTDWSTLFRHETQNDWGTVRNRYLAG